MQKKPRATEKHKHQVTSANTLAASSTALFSFFFWAALPIYSQKERN
jgi:hypothetical protein